MLCFQPNLPDTWTSEDFQMRLSCSSRIASLHLNFSNFRQVTHFQTFSSLEIDLVSSLADYIDCHQSLAILSGWWENDDLKRVSNCPNHLFNLFVVQQSILLKHFSKVGWLDKTWSLGLRTVSSDKSGSEDENQVQLSGFEDTAKEVIYGSSLFTIFQLFQIMHNCTGSNFNFKMCLDLRKENLQGSFCQVTLLI